MHETVKTGKVATAEHVHYGAGGEKYYSEIITYPIFDEAGKVKAVVHLSRDTTKRRRVEEEHKKYTQKLRDLSLRDPHTGLHNYRYFMDRPGAEIELCRRHALIFSLLIIDIDYFKSINDVYGHQVGDNILIEFSGFIKNMLRKSDILARYGGEEFIAIMPRTDKKKALSFASRLIEKTYHSFKHRQKTELE